MPADFDAIVLAGGAGRRMGGLLKPVVPVAGMRMVDRVLRAVAGASRVVVVGPAELRVGESGPAAPPVLVRVREEPAGGGPVAAIEAGVRLGGLSSPIVVLVGGDLPALERTHVDLLVAAVARSAGGGTAGALFADHQGRPQWLCGAWRTAAIRERVAALAAARDGVLAGAALRDLLGVLDVAEVRVRGRRGGGRGVDELPPWFDCDTDEDLRRAEEWLSE
jgi:molybdopterin-guanine dinucleotide biosynthesis protein A